MLIEPLVGGTDERFVEPLLRHARLVARDQQDRLPLGIERERHAPHPIIRLEPQLLHVRMTRAGERVGVRTAKLLAVGLQQGGHGEQLVLDRFGQCVLFEVERIVIGYRPRHESLYILQAIICL